MSELKHCLNCGKPFQALTSGANEKKFCSRQCQSRWHAKQNSSSRKVTAEDIKKLEERYQEQNKDVVKKICYG